MLCCWLEKAGSTREGSDGGGIAASFNPSSGCLLPGIMSQGCGGWITDWQTESDVRLIFN